MEVKTLLGPIFFFPLTAAVMAGGSDTLRQSEQVSATKSNLKD